MIIIVLFQPISMEKSPEKGRRCLKNQASAERSVALKELARSLRGDLELLSCLGRSKKCMVNHLSYFFLSRISEIDYDFISHPL